MRGPGCEQSCPRAGCPASSSGGCLLITGCALSAIFLSAGDRIGEKLLTAHLVVLLAFDKNAKCYISWSNYSRITSFNFFIFKYGDFTLFASPSLFCLSSFCQASSCKLWSSAPTARLLGSLFPDQMCAFLHIGSNVRLSPQVHASTVSFHKLPVPLCIVFGVDFIVSRVILLGGNLCFLHFFPQLNICSSLVGFISKSSIRIPCDFLCKSTIWNEKCT